MADKVRFARLINERLRALDRSAAWLAREVGESEVNISRWRDDAQRTMPRDPEVVHALAAALKMGEAEERAFFAAAGLVYQPPAAGVVLAPAVSDPEHIAAYLEAVRSQCGRTETRPYRQLSELRGATPSFTLRDEADRCGVYVPLRFDLHPARPAGEGLEADDLAPVGKASRCRCAARSEPHGHRPGRTAGQPRPRGLHRRGRLRQDDGAAPGGDDAGRG